ncbi:MAG: hypothetical protein HYV27_02290, partial [Candidatus Hydrogenedentes bacterium]|nr:hypothetical protein [Candidatus Hydrogenedentota bacterium]
LDYVHKQRESLHAELDELEALGEPAESEADDEEGDDAPTGALVTNLADYMKPVIEEMQACTGLHPGVNDLKDLIEWCVRQDLRGEYFPQWTPNLQLSREADVARGREADPPEEHQAHERKTPEEMDRELLAQIGLETDPARYDAGQDHAGQDGTRQEDAEYDAVYDAP